MGLLKWVGMLAVVLASATAAHGADDGAVLASDAPAPVAVPLAEPAVLPAPAANVVPDLPPPFADVVLPAAPPHEPARVDVSSHALLKSGMASWYGPGFHGRRTANGERYNMHELTAAHRYLPFGTLLQVRSVHTGKTVVVRVNDRGPYKHQRILDLSRAAMDALGVLGRGVTQVEVWVQAHQLNEFQAKTERFFSRHPGSAPKTAPTTRSSKAPSTRP